MQLIAFFSHVNCTGMQITRYLAPAVSKWLNTRMVFIGGPRQVGKTFLGKTFIQDSRSYLSWDDLGDREIIRSHRIGQLSSPLLLDEIHKYSRWRSLVKGIFDKKSDDLKIIVTGSARLDHFRKGGDSLFGRYHYLRLHPFSLPELLSAGQPVTLEELLEFGGFPEPFLQKDPSFLKIWRRERVARVITQDLRDLTNLKDYSDLEILADILPSKVGSLLSYNSIGEDLEKSPHTIKNWVQILGSVYHCYTVAPYGPQRIKALKKQQKLYLWDWSVVPNEGAKFENLVASQLLKYCHYVEDTQGDAMELRFLKDEFGREIDFVVLQNRKPLFAVEVQSGEKDISSSLRYFSERISVPAYFQVHRGQANFKIGKIEVIPFADFCRKLNMP
jgi:predicted AAA+ superfamily ATPase